MNPTMDTVYHEIRRQAIHKAETEGCHEAFKYSVRKLPNHHADIMRLVSVSDATGMNKKDLARLMQRYLNAHINPTEAQVWVHPEVSYVFDHVFADYIDGQRAMADKYGMDSDDDDNFQEDMYCYEGENYEPYYDSDDSSMDSEGYPRRR